MKEIRILGIYINERVKEVHRIQSILTKYGCSIRTRLGLHSAYEDFTSDTGLILLELTGNAEECLNLENELLAIDGLDVKKMVFLK